MAYGGGVRSWGQPGPGGSCGQPCLLQVGSWGCGRRGLALSQGSGRSLVRCDSPPLGALRAGRNSNSSKLCQLPPFPDQAPGEPQK